LSASSSVYYTDYSSYYSSCFYEYVYPEYAVNVWYSDFYGIYLSSDVYFEGYYDWFCINSAQSMVPGVVVAVLALAAGAHLVN
jgi:hypothetical protein